MRGPRVSAVLRGVVSTASVCITALGCASPSPSPAPDADYRPLVVSNIQCGVMQDCFGSYPASWDSPEFVIYDNGVVLFSPTNRFPYPYWIVVLTPTQLHTLLDTLPFRWLDSMPSHLGGGCANQQNHVFETWFAGVHRVHVACADLREGKGRGELPSEFLRLYDALTHFHYPGSHPWAPAYIRVAWRLADSSSSASACTQFDRTFRPQRWPDSWSAPPASDSAAAEWKYTILPTSELKHFLPMVLREYPDCTPIEVDGRYWQVGFTYPFPADSMWHRRRR